MGEQNSSTLLEPNYIRETSQEIGLQEYQTQVVLDFIAEGATVPFIARYRKEKTGNLDEDQIRNIIKTKTKIENLYEAKRIAINGIEEQEKMTPELMDNILKAKSVKEVEDIYKPYKSKKKTKAMIAIENGFQPIANLIKQNQIINHDSSDIQELLTDFSFEDIIEGSQEIIGAEISANADLRADLLETLKKYEGIISKYKTEKSLDKLNTKDKAQIPKFEIYSNFYTKISQIKPYQILALNRGEKLGILNIKIDKTTETYERIAHHYARILAREYGDTNISHPFSEQLELGFKKGYDALFSSVENEIRAHLSEIGEDDAIETFQTNLKKLLMTRPEYGKKILAIDPGYAAGCKIAFLDSLGNPQFFTKIYLHREEQAKTILNELFIKYNPDVVVVGNGTGNKEVIQLLHSLRKIPIFIVNESGASVYSASKIAAEEFPDLDALDRGTVSIGRRYIDPLSELVKIPVGSIGVGLYQHDVPAKKLEEELGNVVEDVVNEIGINVNNASSYVLEYISGISKRLTKKIYTNRPYSSRKDLKKQMTAKTYQQAIGFLRIPESPEELDNTDIHPEQYPLAKYILENIHETSAKAFFSQHENQLTVLYPDVTVETVQFILNAYADAGVEKRKISTHKQAIQTKEVTDISEGDIIDGIVKNVVAFGAFVDIGMKNDGLVHISHIADSYVANPNEFLEVGQDVRVKVLNIDENTGKISLSMRGVSQTTN